MGSDRAGVALAQARRIWLALALVLFGAGAVAGIGCGEDPQPPARSTALLPDGTVPWVDERATEQEVAALDPQRHRPSPAEAADVEPCGAGALAGELDRWTSQLQRDDFGKVIGDSGLLGFVRVRNTGRAACRLRDEVPARLLVAGRPLDIRTAHGVNEDARGRGIAIEPGEAAELRLDWSSPFCGEARGRQVLVLTLPGGGGQLRAPVRRAWVPRCFSLETQPARRSVLSSGVFEYPRVATPLDSPLNGLRARVIAPAPAAPVRAGAVLTYHVVLSNPTKRAIALRPCPAYYEERFSLATPGHDDAVNDGRLSRLNCAPVRSIAAGGRRRFEMKMRVPAELGGGRRFSVAWGMRARGLAGGERLQGGFEVTIR